MTDRILIGEALLAAGCLTGFGACPSQEPNSNFDDLKVGQVVNVRDLGTVYEIRVFERGLPA